MTTILTEVEAGYARVLRTNGRSIGYVGREKHGSTRTGTMWFAYQGSKQVGLCYTRAEAIQSLVTAVEQNDAKVAAFLNTSN